MEAKMIKERLYYKAPTSTVIMSVFIKGIKDSEKLKEALQKAISVHGVLNSKLVENEKGEVYYSPIKEPKIPIDVLQGEENEKIEALILKQEQIPFKVNEGELMRILILQQEEGCRVLIASHHTVGDGLSYVYFIRDMMNHLSQPNFKQEKQSLSCFEESQIPQGAKLNFLYRAMMNHMNKNWEKHRKIFSWEEFNKMFKTYWSERKLELLVENLNAEELQELLKQCKAHGVTMNTAIATALAIAGKKQFPMEKPDIAVAASIREKGFEGMRNDATGISIQYNVDEKLDFWQNAKNVHQLIHKKLDNEGKRYLFLNFLNSIEGSLIDATYFEAFTEYDDKNVHPVSGMLGYGNGPKGTSLSNLAKVPIPANYGIYEISDLIFLPPLVPNSKRAIGVATLGDHTIFTMQYLKGCDETEMKDFFKQVMELLRGHNS